VGSENARQMFKVFVEMVLGVEPDEVSLLYFLFYIHSAGGAIPLADVDEKVNGAQSIKIAGGAQRISEGLADRIGLNQIQFNSPVDRIDQSSEGCVRVFTRDNKVYEAKRVVLALAPALAGRIRYSPPMPIARDQLCQRMPMGSILKCFLFYRTAWWLTKGYNGLAVDNDGPVKATFDACTPDGKIAVLVAFVPAREAQKWSDQPAQLFQDAVVEHIGIMFASKEDSRAIIHFVAQNWAAEEFSAGCYVGVMAPGVLTACGRALRTPVQRLHFAGTETATEWSGYIEGAIQAGERAAREVATLL